MANPASCRTAVPATLLLFLSAVTCVLPAGGCHSTAHPAARVNPAGPPAGVAVERVDYHGWPGCFRLTNGTVDVVVVPQIGRVMRYGPVGGPNLLWENPALPGH